MASFLDSLFGTPPAGQVAPPQQVNYSSVPTLQYDASQINPTQTSMLGGISNLGQYNIFGQNMPLAENIGAGMINDPNAMLMTGAAPTAAGMGMGAGVGAYGAGSNLLSYMNPIMQQAMDPQSQLYNYLFNQNQQQAQAVNQMSGVGGTPYGAGVVDQANQLFNMNWQNQQLNRLLSGAQGAGAVGQTGAALQAGAPGTFMGGASIPYMTSQGIGAGQLGTLANLGQYGINAAQIPGQQIAGWQQSLPIMLGAQQQAFNQPFSELGATWQENMGLANFQLQQAQAAAQESAAAWGGIGLLVGAGLGAFGGPAGMALGSQIGSRIGGGGGSGVSTGVGGQAGIGSTSLPWGWNFPGSPFGSK